MGTDLLLIIKKTGNAWFLDLSYKCQSDKTSYEDVLCCFFPFIQNLLVYYKYECILVFPNRILAARIRIFEYDTFLVGRI